MRHLRRFLGMGVAAVLAGTTVLLVSCGEDGPGLVVPRPDTTAAQETAAGLFRTYCAGCHAFDGQALGAGIDDLRGYGQSFEQFDSVMTAGPGLMPRFPQINQQGRRVLYDHIRSFRR